MSKLKKILATSLMVFVSCFTFLGTAISNVAHTIFSFGSANASTIKNTNDSTSEIKKGNTLTIAKVPNKVSKNTPLELPYLTNNGIQTASADAIGVLSAVEEKTNVFVEITDATKKVITTFNESDGTTVVEGHASEVNITTSNKLILTPRTTGNYKVQYFVKNAGGVWTSSVVYNIEVKAEAFSMEIEKNNPIVMPSTLSTAAEETQKDVSISLPLIYGKDGKLIESFVLGGQFNDDGEYYYLAEYKEQMSAENDKISSVVPTFDESISNRLNINSYDSYKAYSVKRVNGSIGEQKVLQIDVNAAGEVFSNKPGTAADKQIKFKSDVSADGVVYNKVAYDFTAKTGKNIITYKFLNGLTVDTSLSYTITGSKTFKKDKVDLTASASSLIRSSLTNQGDKVYLPKISAVDKNNNNTNINAFYYYTVQLLNSDGSYESAKDKVVMGQDEKGLYFIPKAVSGSRYEIYYNVVDFYGATSKSDANYDYEITVNDRQLDEVKYLNSYDPATIENEDLENREAVLSNFSHVIPNKVKIGSTITIPSIYAKDRNGISEVSRIIRPAASTFLDKDGKKVYGTITVSDYSGKYSMSDIINKDVKDILSYNNTGAPIEYTNFNITAEGKFVNKEGADLTGNELRDAVTSQAPKLYLDPTVFGVGTYTVTLSATDKHNQTDSSDRAFTFEIVEEEVKMNAPKVSFGDTVTIGKVDMGADIVLPTPSIVDEIDKRLFVKYYAVIGDKYIQLKLSDDEKNIVFNTNDKQPLDGPDQTIFNLAAANGNKFTVKAFAFNDAAQKFYDTDIATIDAGLDAEEEQYKAIGRDSYIITINNTEDVTAPTIKTLPYAGTPVAQPEQFAEFTVDGITFHDDTSACKLEVAITDTNGNMVKNESIAVQGYKVVSAAGGYDYSIDSVKFVVSSADLNNYYTVTYSLVDSGNNAVSYSFVLLHAKDKEAPIITGLTGSEYSLELGQTLYLNKLTAVDNGEISSFEVKCYNSNDQEVSQFYNPIDQEFSPDYTGRFKLVFVAQDADGNKSNPREIIVNVKDSIKPTIKLNATSDTIVDDTIFKEEDINKETSVEVFPSVIIPQFVVEDTKPEKASNSHIDFSATGRLTIKAPKQDDYGITEYKFDEHGNILDGVKNTIEFQEYNGAFKFIPEHRGEYVITYSAVDKNGNKAEDEVIRVHIGDTIGPEIVLSKAFKEKLAKGFILGENDNKLVINPNANIGSESNSADLYVVDDSGFEEDAESVYVTISIIDPNGNTISKTDANGKNEFTFTKAGTYTVRFEAYDEIRNRGTENITFTVKAKPSSTVDSSTILGTVLIVISVVVLVGVIIYFIKGTKFLPKKNKTAKNKKENQNKEDKKD